MGCGWACLTLLASVDEESWPHFDQLPTNASPRISPGHVHLSFLHLCLAPETESSLTRAYP